LSKDRTQHLKSDKSDRYDIMCNYFSKPSYNTTPPGRGRVEDPAEGGEVRWQLVNRAILMNCYAEFLKNNRQNRQNGQNRQILQCFVGAGVESPPHPEDIDDSREEVGQVL
jgi:hypothetical protein